MFIEYGIKAFRRFVLDTLAKLDEQDRENGLSATQGQSQHVYQSAGSLSNSSNERNKHVASPYARVSGYSDSRCVVHDQDPSIFSRIFPIQLTLLLFKILSTLACEWFG